MATYGDLQDRIAQEIHRDDLTSEIQNEILSAVAFYANDRFVGNEERGTITTIDGTRFYDRNTASPGTLPTNISEIDSIVCTVNSRDYVLERRSYQELEEIDSGTDLQGDPTRWAWYGESLRLYPTPNAARVLTLSYQVILTELSSSGDENFWTTKAEALIRARAKKLLALNTTQDPAMAQAMALIEREELTQLKKAANKLISSGRIKATAF